MNASSGFTAIIRVAKKRSALDLETLIAPAGSLRAKMIRLG